MNPTSGPSSPTCASAEQLPAGSFGTPPKTAPKHSSEFVSALDKIFAGVDVNQLLHAIDTITGDHQSYTIVGSTALYLNALARESEQSGLPPQDLQLSTLPLPNDIDLVASAHAINNIEGASEGDLKQLGLTRQDGKSHVFYIARKASEGTDREAALKIDFISAKHKGFERYSEKPNFLFGQRVANVTVLLEKYQDRHKTDEEFVANNGGEEKAHEKIMAWNNHFNYKPKVGGTSASEGSSTGLAGTDTRTRRARVLFPDG